MDVRIVFLPSNINTISDEIYESCLQLIDSETQNKISRFRRRDDAWRSLVGALLPRLLLHERKISIASLVFCRSTAGKPYVKNMSSSPGPAFGYSISHDNLMVAIASQMGNVGSEDKIGIDVMKRSIPKNESIQSFLRSIEDTLTTRELTLFTPLLDRETAIKYIFLLWTVKEAYSKALGLGLGFNFRRVDFDIHNERVLVDEQCPRGWEFITFEMNQYQGAIARWVGGEEAQVLSIADVSTDKRFRTQEFNELIEVHLTISR